MVIYFVVEIKKKSILCVVDEMKIVIYECLVYFFLFFCNYRILGLLFIFKYLSYGKILIINIYIFRLNILNVNRNSGYISFVMEIVYLFMLLLLGLIENLIFLGYMYMWIWYLFDFILIGFFKDDEIEFFVVRRWNLFDLIMYVWSIVILDFFVRLGGINKCGRR